MSGSRFNPVSTHATRQEKKVLVSPVHFFFTFTLMFFVTSVVFGFPLTTEDTGTIPQGRSKIELNIERGEVQKDDAKEVSVNNEVALVYGLADHLNGFINLPYRDITTQKTGGTGNTSSGLGDARFGLKWRYIEQGGFSMCLKGGVILPTGDKAKNLGNGQAGYDINVIASYEVASLDFHFNLGYALFPGLLEQREGIVNISTSVAMQIMASWKALADIGISENKNINSLGAPAYVGVGLSHELKQKMFLELGIKHVFTAVDMDNTGLIGFGWIL